MDSFSYYRTDTLRSRAHSDLMLFGTGLILLFCCVVFIIIDNIFMRFRGKQTNFSIKQLLLLKFLAKFEHIVMFYLPLPHTHFTEQTCNTTYYYLMAPRLICKFSSHPSHFNTDLDYFYTTVLVTKFGHILLGIIYNLGSKKTHQKKFFLVALCTIWKIQYDFT